MSTRTILSLLVILLGGALLAPAQAPGAGTPALGGEIELKPKIWRDWKFRLPAETTREVGTAIELPSAMGASFAAGLDGLTLLLDADGDGELETRVKGEAGFVVLARGERRYALRLQAAPKWVFAPGSTMAGAIEGVRIELIDQNLNGRFDDIGEDAMVVGNGKSASFLSQVVDLGEGRLVELSFAPDGAKLSWRPYDGPAGRLDLGIATSGKVLNAVLSSADRRYSVAISGSERSLVLPAGDYRLHSGLISLAGNRVTMTTGRSKPVAVTAEGTAELALGGPVRAEFAYRRKGDEIEFSPDAIWFYGKAGEEYTGWEPLGKSPRISVLEKTSGREIAQAFFPGSC